ncbi:MAG: hypothetical protein V3U76_03730 [Granulosicoccus sp.]
MPDPDGVDSRLWRVDPGALGGPPPSALSWSSPALEQILVQSSVLSSPFGRRLSAIESKIIKSVFKNSVDTSRIRVIQTSIANAPTTLGNQIRVSSSCPFDSIEGKSILIHEAAHVWQYQTAGTDYISCSAFHQIKAHISTGTRNSAYFNYKITSKSKISDYPAEQQAQLIEDYYSIAFRYGSASTPPRWVQKRREKFSDHERLIKSVQSYVPKPQQQIYSDSLMRGTTGGTRIYQPKNTKIAPLVPILEVRF